MDATSSIPPSIPFRVAQAYGVRAPQSPATATPHEAARVQAAADRVELSRTSKARSLVAAKVPQRMDYAVPAAPPAARGALTLYAHPADRHAAATAVRVGRSLDVQG